MMTNLPEDKQVQIREFLKNQYRIADNDTQTKIISKVNETLTSPLFLPEQESYVESIRPTEFIIKTGDTATSIKPENLLYNWKIISTKIGALGFFGPSVNIIEICLGIGAILANGLTIKYDHIDSKIIECIYKHVEKNREITTSETYQECSKCVGGKINLQLFMDRLPNIAKSGAINIDNDILTTREGYWEFVAE